MHATTEDRNKRLEEEANNFTKIDDPKLKKKQLITILAAIFFVPICSLFLNLSDLITIILVVLSIGILGYIIFDARNEEKPVQQKLWVVVVLFLFHAIFWALFEQAGGSITLFTARNVDRMVLGSELPASIFQFFNSFFIILLAPAFSWMWIKLRSKGKEPSTPMKFVLGLSQIAVGFGILVIGGKFFANEGLVPVIFIVLMYFFHTSGELSLSPVGLSMITKLSPKKMVGFIMGIWFLSISLGNKLGGLIGELTAVEGGSENPTVMETLNAYSSTYLTWGVMVVAIASGILLLMVPTLRKWMHGIH